MRLRVDSSCSVLVSVVLCGRPSLGKHPSLHEALPEKKSPAPLPKHKIGPFEISINWRTRAEGWNWFEGPTGNSDYPLWDSLLRIGIGQTRERIDWFAELEQPSILGLPNDAVVAAPQGQLGSRRDLLCFQLQPDEQRQRVLEAGLRGLQTPGTNPAETGTLRIFRRDRSERQRPDSRSRSAVANLKPADFQFRIRRGPAHI